MENDDFLVKKSLQGDSKAFERLIQKYSSALASYTFSHLGRADEMEDILQETFLRAWLNLPTLREKNKFAPWLCGIARWVCQEKIREKKKNPLSLPEDEEENISLRWEGENPKEEGPWPQERIQEALEKLPEIYREALILLYFEKKSYQEIGEILGISKAGVNFRLTKARMFLKEYLILKGEST